MATALRVFYAIAVGVFVVLVVAFGTLTFFPDPDEPDFPDTPGATPVPRVAPTALATPATGDQARSASEADQRRFEEEEAAYDVAYARWREDRDAHRRRVLAGVTLVGALFIVAGIAAAAALDVLRLGLMLGGVLTVLWGLIYAAEGAGSGAAFVAALVVLAALLVLGHGPTRARLQRVLRLGEGDDLLAR